LLWAVVVLTVEVWFYAYRGIDYLMGYECYFYYVVPPLMGVAIAVGVGGRLGPVVEKLRERRPSRGVSAGLVFLSGAGCVLVFAAQASVDNTYRGDPALPRIAAVVHQSGLRRGRGVSVSLGTPGTLRADWVDVVGLLLAASRDGYQPCVANREWKFMMTGQYICSVSEAKERWEIAVFKSNVPIPHGSDVLFRDGSLEVFVPLPAPSVMGK
jgi:hypothetical protein